MNAEPQLQHQRYIVSVLQRLDAQLRGAFADHTYAGGAAGQLLGLAALAEASAGFALDPELIADGVQRLLAAVPQLPHGLFQGAEGTLFSALELDRRFGFGLAEEAAQDFDSYLLDCLRNEQDLPQHFDLISGIAGLSVYATYRARHGAPASLLHACVDRLSAMATRTESGTFWFTSPAWTRGMPMGNSYPLGCTDLGQAHGQPGVLAALAYALADGTDARETTRALLLDGLRFLRRHEQQGHVHFGGVAEQPGGSRCAWCYGDLGIAGALRLCAVALHDSTLHQWTERLLESLSKREITTLGFENACLCHGSCGSAWLLRRISPRYEELAQRYDAVCFAAGPNNVLDKLEKDPAPDLGLLEGCTGVALALALAQPNAASISTLQWSLPLLAGEDALRRPR